MVTRNGTTNQWILNPSASLAAKTVYTVTLIGGTTAAVVGQQRGAGRGDGAVFVNDAGADLVKFAGRDPGAHLLLHGGEVVRANQRGLLSRCSRALRIAFTPHRFPSLLSLARSTASRSSSESARPSLRSAYSMNLPGITAAQTAVYI